MLNRRRILMRIEDWKLPEEYEYISYVSTVENDLAYINTEFGRGLDPKSMDIEIRFSSRGGTNTVSACIYGFRESSSTNAFALLDSGASVNLSNRYGTSVNNSWFNAAKGYVKGNVYTYKASMSENSRVVYIDGEEKLRVTTHPTKLGNIYLMGCNENDSGSITNVNGIRTIYFCKMWYEGTLVRDFIPVKRKEDGKIGLFDKVTNRFYISPNGHDFVQ